MTVSADVHPTTLAGALWPDHAAPATMRAIRAVILAVVGSLFLAISAKVQVPMWPVPMTMQTFAVLVIGMSFGVKLGGATLLLYLAEGAVGLPVFASGSGLAYMMGPTGGYLVGFFLAAVLVGWLAERSWDRNVVYTLIAMIFGTALIFLPGVTWLAIFLGDFDKAIASGLTPFLVGAAVKIALAAALLPFAWRLVSKHR